MVLKGKEAEQKGRENQSELRSYEIDFIKVGTQAKQQCLRKNKAAKENKKKIVLDQHSNCSRSSRGNTGNLCIWNGMDIIRKVVVWVIVELFTYYLGHSK